MTDRMQSTPSSNSLTVPGSPTVEVEKQRKIVEMAGPYVLGKTLGRGTSGKVKAGYHKDTGLDVAVKIVKKEYVKNHKQQIAREIAVMRLLDHPNIMKLYDVYETTRHYFLILERVSGGELFDYILTRGRLPRPEALRILSQIVQGLEYLHMHSICHRDLKPENLLLDDRGNIKIADFGMAQVIPAGEVLNTFCGSPHYGAPEVVSGIKYDGRKSDVWSLGVVFYALVTGMLPFDHKNIAELLRMVKKGNYTIPSFVDADIKDLLKRMLCVDVNRRIRTEEIKYHSVFLGPNNVNLFFPPTPMTSPALEMMKTNPIESIEDINPNIVRDLQGLGWGTTEEIQEKLLQKQREASLHNLELVFYQLLAARNKQRALERGESEPAMSELASPEPQSPAVVSFREPASPGTPLRTRASHFTYSSRARGVTPNANSGNTVVDIRRTHSTEANHRAAHLNLFEQMARMQIEDHKRYNPQQPQQQTPPMPTPSASDPSNLPVNHIDTNAFVNNTPQGFDANEPSSVVSNSVVGDGDASDKSKRRTMRPLRIQTGMGKTEAERDVARPMVTPSSATTVQTPTALVSSTAAPHSARPITAETPVSYMETPRFHRVKMVRQTSVEDSPAAPITPTVKKSWFHNLFKRRPSMNTLSAADAVNAANAAMTTTGTPSGHHTLPTATGRPPMPSPAKINKRATDPLPASTIRDAFEAANVNVNVNIMSLQQQEPLTPDRTI